MHLAYLSDLNGRHCSKAAIYLLLLKCVYIFLKYVEVVIATQRYSTNLIIVMPIYIKCFFFMNSWVRYNNYIFIKSVYPSLFLQSHADNETFSNNCRSSFPGISSCINYEYFYQKKHYFQWTLYSHTIQLHAIHLIVWVLVVEWPAMPLDYI